MSDYRTRTFKDNADLQGLQGDAIVDLWILDLHPIDPDIDEADRYIRFCNWVVADGQPVVYDGETYLAIPYKASGFTIQTEGVPPSPSLIVSNIGLEFTALANTWNDLLGAKLTLRRVLARHLDSGSDPDASAHWPDETWYIQQKEDESKLAVTFKLSTAFDLDGVTLPRRRALRYTCPWIYRGEGCDYAGPPVADVNDNPLDGSDDPILEELYESKIALDAAISAKNAAAAAYSQAKADTANAKAAYDAAVDRRDNYEASYVFEDERYNYNLFGVNIYWWEEGVETGAVYAAFWNSQNVLPEVLANPNGPYRRGKWTNTNSRNRPEETYFYYIRKFRLEDTPADLQQNVDNALAAWNAAIAAEASAKTAYDNAAAAKDAAQVRYDAALAAWIAAGSPTGGDSCGKRLQSCRLRFYNADGTPEALPFGGFPGLSLS